MHIQATIIILSLALLGMVYICREAINGKHKTVGGAIAPVFAYFCGQVARVELAHGYGGTIIAATLILPGIYLALLFYPREDNLK